MLNTEADDWQFAIYVDDLWEGEMVTVPLSQGAVLVVNVDGELHVFDDACPHSGTSLGDGELVDGAVICPSHLWKFDACTGAGINPKRCSLVPVESTIRDGAVYVRPLAGVSVTVQGSTSQQGGSA